MTLAVLLPSLTLTPPTALPADTGAHWPAEVHCDGDMDRTDRDRESENRRERGVVVE